MQIHNPATNYCTFIPDHTARYPRRHVRRYHVIRGNVISKARPLLHKMLDSILCRLLITNTSKSENKFKRNEQKFSNAPNEIPNSLR